jgi:myo-inositol-1(or 4)-monophosphatase
MKDLKLALEKAVQAVTGAGQMIKGRLGGEFQTGFKSCPADLVTEVDRHSQSFMVDLLGRAFPGHRLVAEEDCPGDELHLDDRSAWIIDPLDGTTNFVFGIPLCTVTAALVKDSAPVLGVTYDPFRDELYQAVKGKGAFLNGQRITVDSTRDSVCQSLINTGYPSSEAFKDEMWQANFKKILYKAIDLRAFGSAALELAYIACGRLTGYWEVKLRPWDVAAGILLVEEAGGKISRLDGSPLKLDNYVSIVASNSLIHQELIEDLGYIK